jgi:hypothetical protein
MTASLEGEHSAKRIVLDFFDLAFVQRRAAEAAERYEVFLGDHALDVDRQLSTSSASRRAVVEHWDVLQPVPAESANTTRCSERVTQSLTAMLAWMRASAWPSCLTCCFVSGSNTSDRTVRT